ncbi:MAG: spermidine/putrescine transport system permease protein, partial [Mycobacterium sp.]|nr:spermidine/putrescine transport system permease protein [Mycobacterium sp.]
MVATLLGTFAGIALTRRSGRWAPGLLVLLGLVMVTPEIVSAISLLPWFVTLGVDWG